jgi:CRISPR type I-E-associated protein CasB/Cse2
VSPPTESIATKSGRFVERLNGLLVDRAALAALRRGLGKPPGLAPEMHPYVLPWLASEPVWNEDAYYILAALFAYWHQSRSEPAPSAPENLGASLARLKRSKDESDSIERRFVALLNCHRDDLPEHLRHAVGLLKSKDVPIDWEQLLKHIQRWDSENRWVQRHWARGFWKAGEPEREESLVEAG